MMNSNYSHETLKNFIQETGQKETPPKKQLR